MRTPIRASLPKEAVVDFAFWKSAGASKRWPA